MKAKRKVNSLLVLDELTEQRRLNAELQAARAEVRRLKGLLPICAWCKKIRDEGGEWIHIETYIAAHSDWDFTHSICPDCSKTYGPRRFKQKGS